MDELHVGRGTTRGAMTVFPLWGATGGRRRYTMGGRDLEVAEMPEGPDVGSLLVGNRAVVPALVLEGQLFEGGWQHRMSRHSLMVGAGERMAVEVACVEEGRWGGAAEQRTRGRRATPYVADAVRHGADTEGDDVQGEVWSRVAAHTRGVHATATGSLVERLDTFRHEATDWSRVRAADRSGRGADRDRWAALRRGGVRLADGPARPAARAAGGGRSRRAAGPRRAYPRAPGPPVRRPCCTRPPRRWRAGRRRRTAPGGHRPSRRGRAAVGRSRGAHPDHPRAAPLARGSGTLRLTSAQHDRACGVLMASGSGTPWGRVSSSAPLATTAPPR